jgi:hypothetical protein
MAKQTKYPQIIEKLELGMTGNPSSSREFEFPHLLLEFNALETGDARIKHVFATYGLAAYFAQVFEAGLVNMAVLEARGRGEIFYRQEADEFDACISRKTLGAMLKRMRETVEIDGMAAAVLDSCLQKRNSLSHGFYFRNAQNLMNQSGQRRMVTELTEMIGSFRCADWLVSHLCRGLQKVFNIPQSALDEEYERLKAAVCDE